VRSLFRPVAHGSRPVDLAGWATVLFPGGNRTTVWRAGRGAGTLAALFMPAAGRVLPKTFAPKQKARRLFVASPWSRLRWCVLARRAAHQVGELTARHPKYATSSARSQQGQPQMRLGSHRLPSNLSWLLVVTYADELRMAQQAVACPLPRTRPRRRPSASPSADWPCLRP
jgi:hypothetical protein